MANLLSLPNEMLLAIFINSPDAQSAARLSQINKRFRETWLHNSNQILTTVFSRQIPAYDEALALAKAETKLVADNLEDLEISMRELAPSLWESQKMSTQVLSLYEPDFVDTLSYGYTWDKIAAARCYFRSRLVSLAHDNPSMRRGVRKRLRKQSEDELRYQTMFLTWFVDEMRHQNIRDWHDLGTADADNPEADDPYGFLIPMKWHFTVDTVNLQLARLMNPDETIGEQGLWSNSSAQGFQTSWW